MLVEGLRRATLETITQEEPYLLGKVRPEPERPEEESIEMQALVRTTQDFLPPMPRPANGFLLKP